MYDGPIIDAHTHVWADELYWQAFIDHHGLQLDRTEGFLQDTLRYIRDSGLVGLNMLLYHSSGYRFDALTRELPLQVAAVNRWTGNSPPLSESPARIRARAIQAEVVQEVVDYNEWGVDTSIEHPEISCFIGLNPALMSPRELLAELEDKRRRGAKGVKLVAFDYGVMSDDSRMFPIYDYCQAEGLPILFGTPNPAYYNARPEVWGRWTQLDHALRRFPRLKVIAAHLGVSVVWADFTAWKQIAELSQRYPYVYGDLANKTTPIARGRATPEELLAQIREIGAHRVIFGTNYGTHSDPASARNDVIAFRELDLEPREFELIALENFREITGG